MTKARTTRSGPSSCFPPARAPQGWSWQVRVRPRTRTLHSVSRGATLCRIRCRQEVAEPDARRVIARRPLRTVRPADLEGVFANPRAALRRLEHQGVVHRLAYGYYCEVPAEADPDTWLPSLEAAAMGVALARGGPSDPVLMGMSAARVLGALPRAVATATVAVAVGGRRPVRLADRPATVRFVERDTSALDAERMSLDLGAALVTTPEQTLPWTSSGCSPTTRRHPRSSGPSGRVRTGLSWSTSRGRREASRRSGGRRRWSRDAGGT